MESLNTSQNNITVENHMAPKGEQMSKTPSVGSIHTAGSLVDGSHSDRSKGSHGDCDKKDSTHQLPTFTNEVVVIRPEVFYENEDCQTDNKFMKSSGLKRQSTNDLVSIRLS